jgi:hypothetical protein
MLLLSAYMEDDQEYKGNQVEESTSGSLKMRCLGLVAAPLNYRQNWVHIMK